MPSRLNRNPVVDEVTMIVPVASVQVGWIILTVGAGGAPGTLLITTFPVAAELHPSELVTVKL